jgi:hypothetical protein
MSKIWVPDSAKAKHQCNVPGCGAEFNDTEKYMRHVPQCAAAHRGGILDLAEEHAEEAAANPLISGLPFDEEAMEFQLRKYGQR